MRKLKVKVGDASVSAAFHPGDGPVLVLAHGAGGDMDGPFLVSAAETLASRGIGCLRFNFVYREMGKKAPDRAALLSEAWRAAYAKAAELGGPVWAGGKSMGGRYASMLAADGDIDPPGLVFFGYPLHPPGKPERIRDEHLYGLRIPMLFIQGTGDPFAKPDLLAPVLERLGKRATLHEVEGGDHSFRVRGQPKDDAEAGRRLGDVAASFIRG
ncbi:MAG TPA: alpha/beta family hydrolase [Actinomycetota bacterium]|jgi:hypothetical protein